MIERFKKIYHWLLRLVHPMPLVGGLHISDQLLCYVVMFGNRPLVTSVRLVPGVFEDGVLRDRAALLAALQQLRHAIHGKHGSIQVIVTLETGRVYTELLTLPALASSAIPAALDLNLRARSPFPIASAYYDAESVGVSISDSPEFLAAYVDRGLIDAVSGVLENAGFVVVAIEFAGLSMARTCAELGGIDPQEAVLILGALNDGMDLLIVRNKHLYFHDWSPWRDLHVDSVQRTVDAQAFESAVTHAVRRVLSFYTRQWGGTVTRVVLVAEHLETRLRGVMKKLGLTPVAFTPVQFVEVATSTPVALGAALRGFVPRGSDTMISLASVGTERGFLRDTFLHFIAFWRHTILATLVLLFAIFLVADSFLSRIAAPDRGMIAASGDAAEAQKLSDRARVFNTQLEFVQNLQSHDVALAPLIKKVHDLAGSFIVLRRVSFNADNKSGVIVGRASSEFSAINFKNNLGRNIEFFDLDLPFAQIVPEADGVTFQLTFNFRKTSS